MLLLCACASYSGRGLKTGASGLEEVLHVMGPPAMRWQNEDSSTQLVYTRGPMGFHTYMVYIGADGKLLKIENVLEEKFFSHIQPGLTKDQVLHLLGPSTPAWTVYFKARDELVWEWRYCDVWNKPARFDVLFDAGKGTARSTLSITEDMMWPVACGLWLVALYARTKRRPRSLKAKSLKEIYMKIQYNKNEIIAAARYILENKPSSKIPSEIPHTDRGYLPERGLVDEILRNLRVLAKENKEVFEAVQQKLAAGDTYVDTLWQKWVEVLGVGGYWLIANIEGSTINFAIAVTPWFGDYVCTQEEI